MGGGKPSLGHYCKVSDSARGQATFSGTPYHPLCLHGNVWSIRWLRYRRAPVPSKNGQDIHSYRKYLPNLSFGSTFAYGQIWQWKCICMGTHSKTGFKRPMVYSKKFRREVCANNPSLVVSICAVCNRTAASRDLRLLVLAEKLHECWAKVSGQMPPKGGSLKAKPGLEPSD